MSQDMIEVATIPPPPIDPAAIALAAGVHYSTLSLSHSLVTCTMSLLPTRTKKTRKKENSIDD
jgi:hypothetical protein